MERICSTGETTHDRKGDGIRFPPHLKRAFSFIHLGTASSNFVGERVEEKVKSGELLDTKAVRALLEQESGASTSNRLPQKGVQKGEVKMVSASKVNHTFTSFSFSIDLSR